MTSFGLKIVALISMLCDHFGLSFLPSPSYLNVIGRIAFPIFAFQISEGYIHTKNLKKYFLRLGLFALISQIALTLFLKSIGSTKFILNIFFTLFIGLLSITLYDFIKTKYNNKYLGIIPVLLLAILGQLCMCDYGAYGVVLIFLFYLFKNNKLYMNISVILAMIIKYIIDYLHTPHIYQFYFAIGAMFSLLFINLYNNKKGKNIKYLLYIFYPLHLILFSLIKIFILN